MQNEPITQALSLFFSPSSTLTFSPSSFRCRIENNENPQPVFEWISIHARIHHRWAELQVTEVQSEENGFKLHLSSQKYPDITAQCTLHISDGLLTASLDQSIHLDRSPGN